MVNNKHYNEKNPIPEEEAEERKTADNIVLMNEAERLEEKYDNLSQEDIPLKKVSPLEKLAQEIKQKVDVEGEVKGNISYEQERFAPGAGVKVKRKISFFDRTVTTKTKYDTPQEADDEALQDCIDNLKEVMDPYKVHVEGNTVYINK